MPKVTQLQSLMLGDFQRPPVCYVCKQLPLILFPETPGFGSDLPAWIGAALGREPAETDSRVRLEGMPGAR